MPSIFLRDAEESTPCGVRSPRNSILNGAACTLRTLRHVPDRLLHPFRRRRARRVLREIGPDATILVLCYGNICRSPYAAASLRGELRRSSLEHFKVDSAGFILPDRSSPPVAQEIARARGLDLLGHRSTLVTRDRLDGADLIVVMTISQGRAVRKEYGLTKRKVVLLGDLDPDPIDRRSIRDPIDQAREVFEGVFSRIDRCLEQMVDEMR